MNNLGNLSEETIKIVMDSAKERGLEEVINIAPMNILKSKTLIKVSKASSTAEYLSNKIDTVCVYIYEKAFDRLTDDQKKILIDDSLNSVSYDFEKGKINIGCPSITVSIDGLRKNGDDLLNAAEVGVMAIQQIIEEEKMEKNNKKSKRNRR